MGNGTKDWNLNDLEVNGNNIRLIEFRTFSLNVCRLCVLGENRVPGFNSSGED